MAKKSKMKLPINEVLGVVGGAVAAGFVTNLVEKNLPNVPSAVKSLIPIGAGIFLAGNKNVILRGVGYGMVAKGGSDLAGAFIPAIGNVDDIFLSAPADQSILSLPADQSVLSGDDDFISGDDDFISEVDEMNGEDAEMLGASDETEF